MLMEIGKVSVETKGPMGQFLEAPATRKLQP